MRIVELNSSLSNIKKLKNIHNIHNWAGGGCDQRNSLLLLNSDKQEIVLNPGGFALLST